MTPTPLISERLINELKQLQQYLERKRNSFTTSVSSTENDFFIILIFFAILKHLLLQSRVTSIIFA